MKTQPTPGPWYINPDGPYLIFGPHFGTGIATTNPHANNPQRWLHEQKNMTNEEYAESEKPGWTEKRLAIERANAEHIVRCVNAAPKAIAVLEKIIPRLARWKKGDIQTGPKGADSDFDALGESLRAALADLKGE